MLTWIRTFPIISLIPGSVADPDLGSVAFLTPGFWMNIPDHISESLVTILKFFDTDPWSGIFFLFMYVPKFFDTDPWSAIFFLFIYLRYSTLIHLPPLRFHCVEECWDQCWDRTQNCCDFGIDSHLTKYHPQSCGPGSGVEKFGSGIQNKHPGSASLKPGFRMHLKQY